MNSTRPLTGYRLSMDNIINLIFLHRFNYCMQNSFIDFRVDMVFMEIIRYAICKSHFTRSHENTHHIYFPYQMSTTKVW